MLNFPHLYLDESSVGGLGSSGQQNQQSDDWKAKFEASQTELTSLKGQLTTKTTEAEEATKRFTGLQKVYQTEKDAHTLLQTEHAKLTTQFQTAFTEAETFKNGLAERDQKLAQLTADHTKATTGLERARLIMSKYPELAPFEANGLLPTPGEGKTLEDVLGAFKTSLDDVAKKANANFAAGASLDPAGTSNLGGSSAQNATVATLQAKANEAAITGKSDEYNNYMDQILKLTAPKA